MSRGFGPNELLDCYRRGVFPMADSRDDPRLFLVDPDLRGVLPLDGFHISKSLRKLVRQDRFAVPKRSPDRRQSFHRRPGERGHRTYIQAGVLTELPQM